MCVRVGSETVDKVGDRSVLFVDSLHTIGFVCDNLDLCFKNAVEQEVDFKNASDRTVDLSCACGKFPVPFIHFGTSCYLMFGVR